MQIHSHRLRLTEGSQRKEKMKTPGGRQASWERGSQVWEKVGKKSPKKENRERGGHGARLQRWRSGERGPGVNTRPLRPHWPFFQARRAGLQAPHQGPAVPLLWQLQGSWLREVLPLRLWKVRGLLAAHQFAHPRPLSLLQRGLAPRSKGKARAD